jgi:thiamine biosynthesis lipoprotein
MKEVLAMCDDTKRKSGGYFDIRTKSGALDTCGLVKGWAIWKAAEMLRGFGYENYLVDIAGDIQTNGKNADGEEWSIGIRNPFNREEIIKVIYPRGAGVATSGTSVHPDHIYDPFTGEPVKTDITSITVIGSNVYEADRFATPAFAMGRSGIEFIETLPGFEGYCVDNDGIAMMTSGFEKYLRT